MFRVIWALVTLACILYIFLQFQPDRLQTNLFDLLPSTADDSIPHDAIDAYSERLSRKVGILITAQNHVSAVNIAEQVSNELAKYKIFNQIQVQLSNDYLQKVYQTYFPYRYGLLTKTASQNIRNDSEWLVNRLLNALASPMSGLNSAVILDDPFLLQQDFLSALPKGNPRITMTDGYATVRHNEQYYILVAAELNASPFDQALQDKFRLTQSDIVSNVMLDTHQSVEFFGVIRHAVANRRLAQSEMTVIGTGSLVGILIMFITVFRRSVRLLLILLPVVIGMILALTVSMLLFTDIHLISLVFGISLIGVAIDYALHYSCANSSLTSHDNGMAAMRAVRPALTLGLFTTVVGYATLATTEFPALRQMAVIAIAGLVGAYLTVILWLPLFLNQRLRVRPAAAALCDRYISRITRMGTLPLWGIAMSLLLLFFATMYSNHSNDDIKMMRANLPHLDRIDEHFKQVLSEYPNSQYILVADDTDDGLLAREQAILQRIRQHPKINGRVEGLSDWIPSQKTQLANHQLLRTALANTSRLSEQLQQAGISDEVLTRYITELTRNELEVLVPEKFLTSPIGKQKADAWLGTSKGKSYSIISLYGVTELQQLSELITAEQNVYLIDRLGTVSAVFAYYRGAIVKMFPYVLLAILAILVFRYGVNGAIRVVAAPVIAALSSFIIVQSIVGHYNLFTMFGLIITIAISIDYAIFIRETKQHYSSTYLAISLAGFTTILAFGLLSLSETPALRTFGLTLLFGIPISYAIMPFIVAPEKQSLAK